MVLVQWLPRFRVKHYIPVLFLKRNAFWRFRASPARELKVLATSVAGRGIKGKSCLPGICGEKDPKLNDDCKRVCEGQCMVQQQVAGANVTSASPSIKVPWANPKTTLNFYPINSEHLKIQYHKYRGIVQNDCSEGCTVQTARGCKDSLRRVVIKREEKRQRQTGKPFSTLGLKAVLPPDISAMLEAGDRRLARVMPESGSSVNPCWCRGRT